GDVEMSPKEGEATEAQETEAEAKDSVTVEEVDSVGDVAME
ncbi:hypothetical protein KIPB_010327, partial [Kipferlia bialata]